MPNQRSAETRLRDLGRLPTRDGSPDEDGPTGAGDLVSRLDPGGPGLKVLVVAAVLAAVAGGGLALWSRPHEEPVAAPEAVQAMTSPRASPPPPPAASPSPSPSVTVHVAGKVRKPGIVTLAAGSRVADAIKAAGGAKGRLDSVNLARPVQDGEQIAVGTTPAADHGADPAAGATGATGEGGVIDLNAATAEQLQTLPGIGEVLAGRIIEHRDRHGGFRRVEELRNVSGIGEARFADIKDRVRVG